MARPKKANINELATAKIEHTFWRLLETERYSDITVLRISQESGTNRNSFYYHYKDIEDLAHNAFMNNADSEVSKALLATLLSFQSRDAKYPKSFDPRIIPHAKRIMLCAGSESAFLNHMVYERLKEIWFNELSINEELLSPAEKLQIHFIFSGLVATLGSPELKESPQFMSLLSQTDIGKAAVATLKSIALAQNKCQDEGEQSAPTMTMQHNDITKPH